MSEERFDAEEVWQQFREEALPPTLSADEVRRHKATLYAGMLFIVQCWHELPGRPRRERFLADAHKQMVEEIGPAIEKAGYRGPGLNS